MNIAQLDWRIVAAAAAAAVIAVGVLLVRWFSRPPDPDQIERERRYHVNQVGRIVEGQVLELIDAPAPQEEGRNSSLLGRKAGQTSANGHRKLVCYSYSISGVSYETAQDITGLESHVRLERLVSGQAASVKYDPSNPSNSILLAEDWSGLH